MWKAFLMKLRILTFIYIKKMDCTTDFYRSFGELLTKYAALSKVTYKEVSAELGISSKTYAKV